MGHHSDPYDGVQTTPKVAQRNNSGNMDETEAPLCVHMKILILMTHTVVLMTHAH